MLPIRVDIYTPFNPHFMRKRMDSVEFERLSDAYVRTSADRDRSVIKKNMREVFWREAPIGDTVWDFRMSPEVYIADHMYEVLVRAFGDGYVIRADRAAFVVGYCGASYAVERTGDVWAVTGLQSDYECEEPQSVLEAIRLDFNEANGIGFDEDEICIFDDFDEDIII